MVQFSSKGGLKDRIIQLLSIFAVEIQKLLSLHVIMFIHYTKLFFHAKLTNKTNIKSEYYFVFHSILLVFSYNPLVPSNRLLYVLIILQFMYLVDLLNEVEVSITFSIFFLRTISKP